MILLGKVQARVHKVGQTKHLWIFTFRDPVNHFMQSAILSKDAPWERVAEVWDKVHKTWNDELRNRRWGIN